MQRYRTSSQRPRQPCTQDTAWDRDAKHSGTGLPVRRQGDCVPHSQSVHVLCSRLAGLHPSLLPRMQNERRGEDMHAACPFRSTRSTTRQRGQRYQARCVRNRERFADGQRFDFCGCSSASSYLLYSLVSLSCAMVGRPSLTSKLMNFSFFTAIRENPY